MENPETKTHLLAHARRDDDALTHAREKHLKKESTFFSAKSDTRIFLHFQHLFAQKSVTLVFRARVTDGTFVFQSSPTVQSSRPRSCHFVSGNRSSQRARQSASGGN